MSRTVSEEEFETAMQAWARESIDATAARTFTVHEADHPLRAPRDRSRRRALPLLAAAMVLVLVAAGLTIRHMSDRKTGQNATAISAPRCPAQLPNPSGTPTGSPAADSRPLFTRPVVAMTACSYTSTSRQSPDAPLLADVPLDRELARQLAQHLNSAATISDDPTLCLRIPNFSLLLARDDQGAILPTITLTPGCQQLTASNGTTTRYLDINDAALQQAAKAVDSALRHK
jgi:hypothetical protein